MNILFKVLVWRLISIFLTLLVALIMTRDIKMATSFTLVLHAILVVAHTAFEIAWNRTGSATIEPTEEQTLSNVYLDLEQNAEIISGREPGGSV